MINNSDSNAQIPESERQFIALGEQIVQTKRKARKAKDYRLIGVKAKGQKKSAVPSRAAVSPGFYLPTVNAHLLIGSENSRQAFPRP